MARKHKHEEHLNAEAWAIPYGDLVTLLLALFVVMYAMSSVNEGKYRVLSESLSEAFHGTPKSSRPIQIGEQATRGIGGAPMSPPTRAKGEPAGTGTPDAIRQLGRIAPPPGVAFPTPVSAPAERAQAADREVLRRIAREVEQALGALIRDDLVVVQRKRSQLEIEIKTDILFSSGVAAIADPALPVLTELGRILAQFPNPIRIEGHTDDQPIATAAYPSNWELSAARASSVLHVLVTAGLPSPRLSVTGYGEFRPLVANDSPENRNRNRRVVVLVLASEEPGAPGTTTAETEADDAGRAEAVAALSEPAPPLRLLPASGGELAAAAP